MNWSNSIVEFVSIDAFSGQHTSALDRAVVEITLSEPLLDTRLDRLEGPVRLPAADASQSL